MSTGNTVSHVTTGKPKVAGAIYTAPLGTTLPTDATSALAEAFVCVGYISDGGVVNENSPETEVIKAWGGDTVLVTLQSKDDTFQFTMIEAMNIDVLKAIYGDDNVTGSLEEGIKIQATNELPDERSWVIDMIYRGDGVKRVCIPDASVSEVGAINYTDSDPVGYETTLNCMPDTEGVTHYEYLFKAATSTKTTTTTNSTAGE